MPGAANIAWTGIVTPIVQVQNKANAFTTNTTPQSITFTTPPVQGNLLILCVIWATISTPAGWTQAVTVTGSVQCVIFYKIAGVSEPSTVTVSGSANDGAIYGMEYSGLTGTLDQTSNATGSGASTYISCGTTSATTHTFELAIALMGSGFNATGRNPIGWNNGFNFEATLLSISFPTMMGVSTKLLSATGAVNTTASMQQNGSSNDVGVIATFF